MSDIIKNAFANLDPDNEQFVAKNTDIVEEIYALLAAKGENKRSIAEKLAKSPSEMTKWLTGMHNLTLRSITKLEVALGEDIILTRSKAQKQFEKVNYVHVSKPATKNTSTQNPMRFTQVAQVKIQRHLEVA